MSHTCAVLWSSAGTLAGNGPPVLMVHGSRLWLRPSDGVGRADAIISVIAFFASHQ